MEEEHEMDSLLMVLFEFDMLLDLVVKQEVVVAVVKVVVEVEEVVKQEVVQHFDSLQKVEQYYYQNQN